MIFTCHIHELFAGQSKLPPVGAKILINQVVGERIVASRDRCMCCEERICSDCFTGLVKRQASSNQFPASFEVEESCVTLVDVPGSRSDAQGAQSANATNTQYNLL